MKRLMTSVVVAGATAIAGCGRSNEYAEPPPPEVTVVEAVRRDVPLVTAYPGKLGAANEVIVRARVPGYLQKVRFTEADFVSADPDDEKNKLFLIDPATYKAEVKRATEELKSAEAEAELAAFKLKNTEAAAAEEAASAFELAEAKANAARTAAQAAAAQARLTDAELDLSYTDIRAPIAGRISESFVDEGNLVGQGEPTPLARIVQMRPVYAYFSADEREVLERIARARAAGQSPRETGVPPIPIRVQLADGRVYHEVGVLDYVDNRVDEATGTIALRARFANEDLTLIPGLFARAILTEPLEDVVVVPEQAILRDSMGASVLVVGADNVVERRQVELGPVVENQRVIQRGVEAGDRVVFRGVQKARPDSEVNPTAVPAEDVLPPLDIGVAMMTVAATRPSATPPAATQPGR